jgi:hypothetical protein
MTLGTAKYNIVDINSKDLGKVYESLDNLFQKKYQEIYYYGAKNNFRLPPYHRLDLSINFIKEKKLTTRTWSLGLYNAYNRRNPYFLYYAKEQGETVLKKFSLFPIIPSISYSLKLK